MCSRMEATKSQSLHAGECLGRENEAKSILEQFRYCLSSAACSGVQHDMKYDKGGGSLRTFRRARPF